MWKKEKDHPGTYSFFSVEGKIDIADFTFKDSYGDHAKEALEIIREKENKKTKPNQVVKKKPVKKVSRETKKPVKKTKAVKPKLKTAPEKKQRTEKQIEQDELKSEVEAENKITGTDEELTDLQRRSAKAKHEKIIIDKNKAQMDLKKSRAELAEVETLGKSLIGYCIALNQNLLDQPRSFIDEFEMAFKKGKSKTDLTDILRIPASAAIEDTIKVIKKELEKFRRAIRKAEKKNEKG